jgi:hypothetical protein
MKQHYFITLEVGEGWETSLAVKNETTSKLMAILINYDFCFLPSKFCFDYSHHTKQLVNYKGKANKWVTSRRKLPT